MKTRIFKLMMAAMLLPLAFISCDKDDVKNDIGVPTDRIDVKMKATKPLGTRSTDATAMRDLNISFFKVTSFKINVGEIEFDFDDDYEFSSKFNGKFNVNDDIELKGPFRIDLVTNGNYQVNTLIKGLKLPVAFYEGMELELEKCKNENETASGFYGETVRIEGEIGVEGLGTVPFVFASDKEFDLDIDFKDNQLNPGQHKELTVDFNLNKLLFASVAGQQLDWKKVLSFIHEGKLEIYYKKSNKDNKENYEFGKKLLEFWKNIVECDID